MNRTSNEKNSGNILNRGTRQPNIFENWMTKAQNFNHIVSMDHAMQSIKNRVLEGKKKKRKKSKNTQLLSNTWYKPGLEE